MSIENTNNKRIARNTAVLYFRMFAMMALSLYTSRIVLATLGQVDFGLYNVIGGIVTIFTIINMAMGCATSRYITFNLGKGDVQKLNNVFSISVIIHAIIAIIIFLLAETIGLWFLNNKMIIPAERLYAAHWIYQFSIITCMVSVMSVPYNALIISHEKMGAYAYISIVEVVLKLAIVYILMIGGFDKLIVYGFLMLFVQILVRLLYQVYCRKSFQKIRFRFVYDRALFKEMSLYAFWSLIGSAAYHLAIQGQNLLLNMFFGPIVNAARGVAVQVQNSIVQFASNFQTAVAPQINKSYAQGNYEYMHSLINASSKYSYFLLFLFFMPVYFECEQVLSWWLVETPNYTTTFLRLMLIICVIRSQMTPIDYAVGAYGKIRNFQLVVGGIMILIVPVSYLVLKVSPKPEYVFIIQISISLIGLIASLLFIHKMIKFSLTRYVKEVVYACLKVTFLSFVIPWIIYSHTPQNVLSFFVVCISCVICTFAAIYAVGLNSNERIFVNKQILKFCSKWQYK